MDVREFLDRIRQHDSYQGQLEHVEVLAERPGSYEPLPKDLPAALKTMLAARGVNRLYSHQVNAIQAARQGQDLVVVTGTASGKTLCYNLPILESLLPDPAARSTVLVSHQGPGARSIQGPARAGRRRRNDPAGLPTGCLRWRHTDRPAPQDQGRIESGALQSGYAACLDLALSSEMGAVSLLNCGLS